MRVLRKKLEKIKNAVHVLLSVFKTSRSLLFKLYLTLPQTELLMILNFVIVLKLSFQLLTILWFCHELFHIKVVLNPRARYLKLCERSFIVNFRFTSCFKYKFTFSCIYNNPPFIFVCKVNSLIKEMYRNIIMFAFYFRK